MREILIDIGRLVRRLHRPTPTGVDRVVLAYERGLRARFGDRVVCVDTLAGRVLRYPQGLAARILAHTQARWDGAAEADRTDAPDARRRRYGGGPGGEKARASTPPLFFCLDHRGLQPGEVVDRLARRGLAEPVCLLHDLIPLTHPEHVRTPQIARHAARVATMARAARLVIANSQETAAQFAEHAARAQLGLPDVLVAHLGIEPRWRAGTERSGGSGAADDAPPPGRPYFVVLGTIEGRKNHLLLLSLWRALAEAGEPEPPELVIVGRRGWKAQAAFDMLDHAPPLKGHVREIAGLGDAELVRLLAGARALLFPSFAEGFGLPLAEALALGVPALVSDIAAFREIGQGIPERLDPLDGPGWRQAILDYAAPGSARRAAQVARLAGFVAPDWDSHLDAVCDRLGLAGAAGSTAGGTG